MLTLTRVEQNNKKKNPPGRGELNRSIWLIWYLLLFYLKTIFFNAFRFIFRYPHVKKKTAKKTKYMIFLIIISALAYEIVNFYHNKF